MCHEWWDEMLYQERIRLTREEADKRKRQADSPRSPAPKPETEPALQEQPDAEVTARINHSYINLVRMWSVV